MSATHGRLHYKKSLLRNRNFYTILRVLFDTQITPEISNLK
jgi:hypothetical protein